MTKHFKKAALVAAEPAPAEVSTEVMERLRTTMTPAAAAATAGDAPASPSLHREGGKQPSNGVEGERQLSFGATWDCGLEAARAARDAHERARGPFRSHADWIDYWNYIRSIGLSGETSPFFRDSFALWTAEMGGVTPAELRAVAPRISAPLARDTLRRLKVEGGYARRAAPAIFVDPDSLGREEMRRLVPKGLRDLPGTWFCRLSGDECRAIPGRIIHRLTGIAHRRLRHAAVVEVLLYAEEYPTSDLSFIVAAFERWEDAFAEAGCDPDVAADVLAVKWHYVIHEYLCPNDAPSPRIAAEKAWRAADARLHGYRAMQRDDEELYRALGDIRLTALPSGRPSNRFSCEFTEKRIEHGVTCETNRKVDADEMSNGFAERLAAGGLRARSAMRAWRECSAAEAFLRDNHRHGRRGFSWDEDVLSPDGKLLPHRHRIFMEAIFADELEQEVESGVVQPRFSFEEDRTFVDAAILPDGAPETARRELRALNAGRSVVFRYVETMALGTRKAEPWWVSLYRSGALLAPSMLPPGLRDARREMVISHRLPRLDSRPAGLVGADGRAAGRLQAHALAAGAVLVPIAALAHGMAVASVAQWVLALTFARVGELLQLTHGVSERWVVEPVEDARGAKGKRPAWLAFPKGGAARVPFIVYDDRTLPLLTALIRLRLLRERLPGGEGVPMSTPCRQLAPRVGEDRYVLAFRGRMLSGDELNYMHRILFVGIQRLRNHDLRHAAANRAGQERCSTAEVALLLKHAGALSALKTRSPANLRNAEMYKRETALQRAKSPAAYADARVQFEVLMGGRAEGAFA